MKPTLLPSVQSILDSVSSSTGKGFEFREKRDLLVHAPLKLARGGMPAHIIYFNPTHGQALNHLVAHECGHVLRMWSVPERERLIPKLSEENHNTALLQIVEDIPELAQSMPIEKLVGLINTQYQGLVQQLVSMPPDIMIEYWLYDDFPDLRSCQQISLQLQRIEALKGLDSQISRRASAKIVAASNTMSYCYFRLVGLHIGQNLVSPYSGSVYINRGKELAEITAREYRNDYSGDIAMINRWAVFFELQDWFSWTGFEDVPPDYFDNE
ncbi:MAG: hypothetical protein NTV33_01135 [Coprothermobacterota bacterium]|nr:hypothetical protein [Coprothermobacterota bacterium]